MSKREAVAALAAIAALIMAVMLAVLGLAAVIDSDQPTLVVPVSSQP